MIVVAILTVRCDKLAEFHEFERAASVVMRRFGAAIERTVTIPVASGASVFREVHVVSFPDAEVFDAYRHDPALLELQPLRDEAIVATEILIGEPGPNYGAG